MLLPALISSRESARRTQCSGTLRQIGLAYQHFLVSSGSTRLVPREWITQLAMFADRNHATWLCPSDEGARGFRGLARTPQPAPPAQGQRAGRVFERGTMVCRGTTGKDGAAFPRPGR